MYTYHLQMFQKIKKNIISYSINFPKTVILLSFIASLIIINGIRYIVQDDDMVRLLPDDIPSIITFHDITEEFGNYEFMYIGIGHEKINALNSDLLSIVWDISSRIEELSQCEEVISISTVSIITIRD